MRKQMKGFIIGVALTLAATTSVTAFAQSKNIEAFFNNIKVQINGKQVTNMDTEPFIYQGRTFVPLRFVAENMGMTVKYNENTGTVEVTGSSASTGTADSTELVNRIKFYSKIAHTYETLYSMASGISSLREMLDIGLQNISKDKGQFLVDNRKYFEANYDILKTIEENVSNLDKTSKLIGINIDSDIDTMKQIIKKEKEAFSYIDKAYYDLLNYIKTFDNAVGDDYIDCDKHINSINIEVSKSSNEKYIYWVNLIQNAK